MSSPVEKVKESFRDIMHSLSNGEPLPSKEEAETTEVTPEAGAPITESAPPKDKETVESKAPVKDEPAKEGEGDKSEKSESDKSEAVGGDADDEDKTTETDDKDGSQTVLIDGEEVTLKTIREWKQGDLRQADYTKKSQANADVKKRLEAKDALLGEVIADASMQEFVKAHPEVLPRLLQDPENTRALLGNAEEIQALWDDYELIADNPRLAERFHGKSEDATATLEAQREVENISTMANYLDAEVEKMGKEFEGVNADEVRDFVLKMGRVPVGENVDPKEVQAGFRRLFTLFFVQSESGNYELDQTLIRNRYEQLATAKATAAAASSSEADDHNASVDAKLKDSAPPASKGSSDSPAPERDKFKPAGSLDEVVHELLGYGSR